MIHEPRYAEVGMKRLVVVAGLALGCALGCDAAPDDDARLVALTVRLTNLSAKGALVASDGSEADIVMSSGVAVALRDPARLFEEGSDVAGTPIESLAEDGSPDALLEHVEADPDRFAAVVPFTAAYGVGESGDLLGPGHFSLIEMTAPADARFAFVMMFAQSNDTIVATVPDGIAIGEPSEMRDVSDMVALFDAGTEVDQELGVGSDQAPRQPAPDTGPDEESTVTRIIDMNDGIAYPAIEEFLQVEVLVEESDDET